MSVPVMPAEPLGPREVEPDDLYEIIDGRKVELPPMSVQSSGLAFLIAIRLAMAGMQANLGRAYTEMLFAIPAHDTHNRRPDIAFVPYTRWPADKPFPNSNAWDVLPELVGEVVSPTDKAEDLLDKVEVYFRSGVRVVWVVYPVQQLVYVYSSPTEIRVLTRGDTLTCEEVVPGFALPLAEVFPSPGVPQ
jgi:Uma2 family endonuclease